MEQRCTEGRGRESVEDHQGVVDAETWRKVGEVQGGILVTFVADERACVLVREREFENALPAGGAPANYLLAFFVLAGFFGVFDRRGELHDAEREDCRSAFACGNGERGVVLETLVDIEV